MARRRVDESVYRMLRSECDRCVSVVEKVSKEIDALPKGYLSTKKVKAKEKEYLYTCVKQRVGNKVVTTHVKPNEVPQIEQDMKRKKILTETLRANLDRINTIKKILGKEC